MSFAVECGLLCIFNEPVSAKELMQFANQIQADWRTFRFERICGPSYAFHTFCSLAFGENSNKRHLYFEIPPEKMEERKMMAALAGSRLRCVLRVDAAALQKILLIGDAYRMLNFFGSDIGAYKENRAEFLATIRELIEIGFESTLPSDVAKTDYIATLRAEGEALEAFAKKFFRTLAVFHC